MSSRARVAVSQAQKGALRPPCTSTGHHTRSLLGRLLESVATARRHLNLFVCAEVFVPSSDYGVNDDQCDEHHCCVDSVNHGCALCQLMRLLYHILGRRQQLFDEYNGVPS